MPMPTPDQTSYAYHRYENTRRPMVLETIPQVSPTKPSGYQRHIFMIQVYGCATYSGARSHYDEDFNRATGCRRPKEHVTTSEDNAGHRAVFAQAPTPVSCQPTSNLGQFLDDRPEGRWGNQNGPWHDDDGMARGKPRKTRQVAQPHVFVETGGPISQLPSRSRLRSIKRDGRY